MTSRENELYNPVTGEHITILESTEDTGGRYLLFDCRVEPGKAPLPPHVHRTQEERFTVISGRLGAMLGGKKLELGPGEGIILPAKVKHQWWNAGDTEVSFRVEVVPARNLEAVLEVSAALAQQGRMNKKRATPKNPFELVNMGKLSETYLPGIPIWFQNIGMTMGSAVGKVLGYDPEFSKYREALAERRAAAIEEAEYIELAA
jgi:quercetin dioxygenase-like cupin family protein